MKEIIDKLKTPFAGEVVKWKIQAAKGDWSTYVAYVDSRAVAQKLDADAHGMWQDDYREVNGLLICRIGIYCKEIEQWIWREDTGTESSEEKIKGIVSDAFKRAAVKWGIGRDLYDMPIIKIKNTGNANGKPYATYQGKKIYDATSVCRDLISKSGGARQIWHDDSKQAPAKPATPKTTTPAPENITRKQGMALIANKITVAIDEKLKNDISYELTDAKHATQRENIINKLNAGTKPADVLAYLTK